MSLNNHCRLYDRYRRPMATLAVLADVRRNWRPDRFGYTLFGCEHVLRFPVVKVLDYAARLDTLLADPNPFALVTAAHLLTQRTRGDVPARYAAKWRLARLLYERDWDRQRMIDLFAVIDWLLHLPQDLERQLWTAIMELERTTDMRYVTSVERVGREEGRKEGRLEGEAVLLRRLFAGSVRCRPGPKPACRGPRPNNSEPGANASLTRPGLKTCLKRRVSRP